MQRDRRLVPGDPLWAAIVRSVALCAAARRPVVSDQWVVFRALREPGPGTLTTLPMRG